MDYLVPLRKRLLTPEVSRWLGESIWLLIWAIDRVTAEQTVNGEVRGQVLGGKVVQVEDVCADLGWSPTQFTRLVKPFLAPGNGFLRALRQKHGYKFETVDFPKFSQQKKTSIDESIKPSNDDTNDSSNDGLINPPDAGRPIVLESPEGGESKVTPPKKDEEETPAGERSEIERGAADDAWTNVRAELMGKAPAWVQQLAPPVPTEMGIRFVVDKDFQCHKIRQIAPMIAEVWEHITGAKPVIEAIYQPP